MKKTFQIILSVMLVTCMVASMTSTAVAAENSGANESQLINQEPPLTDEELIAIEQTNIAVDDYMATLPSPLLRAAPKMVSLNVPLIQQGTNATNKYYYCGPACTLMVAKYLDLVDSSVTQDTLAGSSYLGVTSSGTSSAKIATVLNGLLSQKGRPYRYERTSTSASNFSDSIIYTLDRSYPMVLSVSQMPLYTVNGHFIVLTGYFATGSLNYTVQNVDINDCHYNSSYFGSYTYTLSQITTACNSNAGYFLRITI